MKKVKIVRLKLTPSGASSAYILFEFISENPTQIIAKNPIRVYEGDVTVNVPLPKKKFSSQEFEQRIEQRVIYRADSFLTYTNNSVAIQKDAFESISEISPEAGLYKNYFTEIEKLLKAEGAASE